MQSVPASWVCETSDREVKRRLRVAEGGSENVSGPQVRARDEARNFHLSSVVTGLCGSMSERGDHVVAARGLAQGTASGARGAQVRESRLTSSTGHRFRGARAAQCRAMKQVEPPQPGVVHVQITELSDPRVCRPGAPALVHLQQTLSNRR